MGIKTYHHSGAEYEYSDKSNSSAMRSLKWTIKKEIRELDLEKNGINLLYCAHTVRGIKEHEVEIQEKRGSYSFFLDNKNLYTTNSLEDCVRWAKAAGHIDRNENITNERAEAKKTTTRAAAPATTKAVVSTVKRTTALTATKTGYDLSKLLSWKAPASSRHGWR